LARLVYSPAVLRLQGQSCAPTARDDSHAVGACSRSGGTEEEGSDDGLIGLVVFAVVAILWIAFGAAIVLRSGEPGWSGQWLRSLPLTFQGIVALLLLPMVIGLWDELLAAVPGDVSGRNQ